MRGSASAALAVLLAVLALLAPAAGAANEPCTTIWQGGSGAWQVAANWSAGVPAADAVACIASGTPTLAGAGATARLLRITGGNVAGTGTLTVAAMEASGTGRKELHSGVAVQVAAELTVADGTLRVLAGASLEAAAVQLGDGGVLDGAGAWSGTDGPLLRKPTGAGVATYALGAVPGEAVVASGVLQVPAPGDGVLPYDVTVGAAARLRFAGEPSIVEIGRSLSLNGAGAQVVTATGQDALAHLARVVGSLSLRRATLHTTSSLRVLAPGPSVEALRLDDGAQLVSDGAIALVDAVVVGVGAGNRVEAPGGVRLEIGSVLVGSLAVAGRLEVQGTLDLSAPAPAEGLGVQGALVLHPTAVLRVHVDTVGLVPVRVTGEAALGGTVQAIAGGPDPAPQELTLLEWGSQTGDFAAVDPAALPFGSPVLVGLRPLSAVLLIEEPPVPTIFSAGVETVPGEDSDHEATLFADVDPGLSPADLTLQYGTDPTYGATSAPFSVSPGAGGVYRAVLQLLQPGTTYHVRWVLDGGTGVVTSDDIAFTTTGTRSPGPRPSGGPEPAAPAGPTGPLPAPPSAPAGPTSPAVAVAPQALAPVAAGGPRLFPLTPAGRSAFRLTTSYRLVHPCAAPCGAVVELLARTGRQLFGAGDGRRLARARATLRRGRNGLQLTVPAARLRTLTWVPQGRRVELARVRLRVTLPQADGRMLVTNRDGTLRRPRAR